MVVLLMMTLMTLMTLASLRGVIIAILASRRHMTVAGLLGQRALDDLVDFATIQPYPPALRAIIDFNPLALTHHELSRLADWTKHTASHS